MSREYDESTQRIDTPQEGACGLADFVGSLDSLDFTNLTSVQQSNDRNLPDLEIGNNQQNQTGSGSAADAPEGAAAPRENEPRYSGVDALEHPAESNNLHSSAELPRRSSSDDGAAESGERVEASTLCSSYEQDSQEHVLALAREGRLVGPGGTLTEEGRRAINGFLHANADGLLAQVFDRFEWRSEDLSNYLSRNGQDVRIVFHRQLGQPGAIGFPGYQPHNFQVTVNGQNAGRFTLGNASGEGIRPYP